MGIRQQVLSRLREASPCFLSGEALAQQEGVTRAAVWKAISQLRKSGYRIAGTPRKGYRLLEPPDLLYPQEVNPLLRTTWLGRGPFHYFRETGSTNDQAKLLAWRGCPDGTIVVAEAQSAGRGRLGRTWLSPPGTGLYFSLVLRPRVTPAVAPRVTLLAGVALCRAIRHTAGVKAEIKWPNDILVGSKKLAGILTEMEAETEAIHHLILGIGVNVNMQACELAPALEATSLYLETGKRHSRPELMARILLELESLWEVFQKEGFSKIRDMWMELSATVGRLVGIERWDGGVIMGKAEEIDQEGALLVADGEGQLHRIAYGEVLHVR